MPGSPADETPRGDGAPASSPGEAAEALGRYRKIHTESLLDPVTFWSALAREVVRWDRPFQTPLDWKPPHARWFADGTLNVADNCLDRHVGTPTEGRVAYHWEGEPGERRAVTYAELKDESTRLASALAQRGFGPGDFAAIYLPMVPELPIAMLALARLAMPFTVVFSGFSAAALGDRIRGLRARLLLTADGGFRRGKVVPLKAVADEALKLAPSVETMVVVRRTREPVPETPGRDVEWTALQQEGRTDLAPRFVPADHPLFLLYSSGTTGAPKAIAHSTGGYLVHVVATTRWVFDPRPNDVYWCAADVGWVTGHSYLVFAPLALGMTSVLYEGALDYPTPDRVWAMIERYRATVLYTSPTALRSLRRAGDEPVRSHDLGSLRLLGTVGEAINPAVWEWYHAVVGGGRCPIVDTWWQTETGGILISPAPGLALVPLKPGSATFPLPGIDADVVGPDGAPVGNGEKGSVVVRQPWPGMLLGLYGDDERYRTTYWTRFPGAYYAGDFAYRDSDGYFFFLGRADEVLKVAGHRLGTIEIEDALLSHPGVAEAAVAGISDEIRGEVPVAFVVLRAGTEPSPALAAGLAETVSDRIGKIARPAQVHFVRTLPKTRSGKIMRRVVKAVAEGGGQLGDVSTLEDEASVEEVRHAADELARDLSRRPPDSGRNAP